MMAENNIHTPHPYIFLSNIMYVGRQTVIEQYTNRLSYYIAYGVPTCLCTLHTVHCAVETTTLSVHSRRWWYTVDIELSLFVGVLVVASSPAFPAKKAGKTGDEADSL